MTVEEWKRKNPPIQRKPLTNADRIRSMTDEELAEFITSRHYTPHCPVPQCETDEITDCEQCWLAWLRKRNEYERKINDSN